MLKGYEKFKAKGGKINMKYSDAKFYENSYDIIMLIAALQVMIAHTSAYIVGGGSGAGIPIWRIIAPGPAVVVFFALSGFLTTASYERSQSILSFATKRFFRIYPALIVAIVLPAVVYILSGNVDVNLGDSIWYFMKKFFTGRGHDLVPQGALGNGSLWTIFVQIQFYILTPLIISYMKRIKFSFQIVTLFFLLGLNVLHSMILALLGTTIGRLYGDTCLPYLYTYVLGVVLYLNRDKLISLISDKKFLIPACVLYIVWHWGLGADFFITWTYINPVSGILIAFIASGAGYFFGGHRLKLDISYGLFLWHLPIVDILHCVLKIEYSFKFLFIVWGLSILVAALSSLIIERPLIRIGKRIASYLNGYRSYFWFKK